MAAGTWKVFKLAKHKIGNGSIDLSGGTFYVALHGDLLSTSAAWASAISTWGSCADQAAGGAYTSGGYSITVPVWSAGASAGQQKFDSSADTVFTASTTPLAGVRYGIIRCSAGASAGTGHAVAYVTLTGTEFDLATGNTLTVQYNTSGIFTLA